MPSGHLGATRGLPSRHLSKTKLQNTNSCRGICSFTFDNRPARCSFMLQVCKLCILRNQYSRFRPIRILLHCTRLNTEHLSGALLTLQDRTTTISSLGKLGSRFWNAEQSTPLRHSSRILLEFLSSSEIQPLRNTPDHCSQKSQTWSARRSAGTLPFRAYPKSCNQTWHPRPSGGQASPVATNQSCPSKNTSSTIWTNLEIHENQCRTKPNLLQI